MLSAAVFNLNGHRSSGMLVSTVVLAEVSVLPTVQMSAECYSEVAEC